MREKLDMTTELVKLDTYENEMTEIDTILWKEDNELVKFYILELDTENIHQQIRVVIRQAINEAPQIMEMDTREVTTSKENRQIGNFLNIYMTKKF